MTRRSALGLAPAALLAQARDIKVTETKQLVPPPGQIAPSGTRRALVAGNNAYTAARPLQNAVHDATDLGAALNTSGFHVTLLTDVAQTPMRTAIHQFAGETKPGDVALLFYAGHGVQIGGENHMVPVDFHPESEAQAQANCPRATEVQDLLVKAGASVMIMILDACRTNPFPATLVPATGLALMDGGLGSFIALSAGPGQRADDNPGGRNGLFTHFLLEEMGRPGQPIERMFQRVKTLVFEASGRMQRPWMHSDIVGDFSLHPAARPEPPRPPQADTPNSADAWIGKGQNEYRGGRYEEAVQAFERAKRINPEKPFAYNALGVAYAASKRWSLALGNFSKAIELNPEYAAAYYNRGVAYLNAARYDLAIQDFTWAIDGDPFDPLAYDLRGRAYLSQLQYAEAMADFNQAIQLNGWDATALLGRGKVFFRQGKLVESLRDLSQAIQARPTPEAFENRAMVYRALGRPAQADADLKAAQRH